MPAKIHINIQEKKWSVIDLKKISKIAFKSTFKILAYSKIYKFLEVSILACNDEKMKEYNKIFRDKNRTTNVLSWPRLKNLKYKDLLDKKDISHLISYEEGTLDIGDIAISYETCFKKSQRGKFNFRRLYYSYVNSFMSSLVRI